MQDVLTPERLSERVHLLSPDTSVIPTIGMTEVLMRYFCTPR